MSTDPAELRAQIDATRANLSDDVDTLTDRVAPSNVARRQTDKVKDKLTSAKESVMGKADDVRASAQGSGGGPDVKGRAQDAQGKAKSATRGNPLAAGLIALGAGWLIGAAMPSSEKEKQLAATAKAHAGPAVEQAKQAAQESAQNLKPQAQDAAQSVKGSAQGAATEVKDHGQSAAQDVKGSAQGAKDQVQQSR